MTDETRSEERCVICMGHGIVPRGFYSYPAGQSFWDGSVSPEACRHCKGAGFIDSRVGRLARAEKAEAADETRCEGERWMIYVCENCGKQRSTDNRVEIEAGSAHWVRNESTETYCGDFKAIEVVPASRSESSRPPEPVPEPEEAKRRDAYAAVVAAREAILDAYDKGITVTDIEKAIRLALPEEKHDD